MPRKGQGVLKMIKRKFETSSGSPNSQAWHDWRNSGIGASDCVHIAAKSGILRDSPSWANGKKLLAQKLGVAHPTKTNWRMERGTRLEEEARKRFEEDSVSLMQAKQTAMIRFNEHTGLVMRPSFGEMDKHPFIKASFDGLDFWGRILEIKCPCQSVHDMAKKGVVVEYYKPQLAQQLLVRHGEPKNWTGKEEVYFVSYNPDDPEQDLAIVYFESQSLYQMATQILNANINFYNKWQSLKKLNLPKKVKAFEKKHEGLFAAMAEARSKKKIALEFIKKQIHDDSYEPILHSAKPKKHTSSTVDGGAILHRLFWDSVPPEYRKKPSTVLMSTVKQDISYTDAKEAESDLIEAKSIENLLKPEFEKAKEEAQLIAEQIGYLQGDSFTLYEKAGNIDWGLVCADNDLNKDDFMIRTTSDTITLRALPKPKPEALRKAS